MGKGGEINGSSDGLNNFWSFFFCLHGPVLLTLVLNYTIITLHRLTASASVSVPGENWDSILTFSLFCSLPAAALCSPN